MDFLNNLFKYDNNLTITGLTHELAYIYVSQIFHKANKNIIVLLSTLYEANTFFSRIKNYEKNTFLFPMDDFITSEALAISPELKTTRIDTIESIKNKKGIIVTNLMGYLKYLTDQKIQEKMNIVLKKNDEINREKLIEILDKLDYKRDTIVTTTGEYAVRGFVIDIFITLEDHPIRVEFFGNTIESIRYFDESTQMSIKEINEIKLISNGEIKTDKNSSLLNYTKDSIVITIDEARIKASYEKLEEEMFEFRIAKGLPNDTRFMYSLSEINPKENIYINFINNYSKDKNNLNLNAKEITNFNSNFEKLKEQVEIWHKQGYEIIFFLSKDHQIKTIKELITIPFKLEKKYLPQGFIVDKYVVISENDIEKINQEKIKYRNSYKIGHKIKDLNSLNKGDYVVHMAHGIGIYNGIKTLTKKGLAKDYIEILYADNDKVYVPVEKMNTILKYTSKDGLKPKINKLNSTSWAKTKRAVEKKIKDISEELLKLYAERKALKGDAYKTYDMENDFANSFAYTPTRDQEKAIKEIDKDLKDQVPMDRLLCGDVGFGKTEVAFRAMFKAILNNKQVFYLCPTTILSKQQFLSASERFKDYPVEIALLNRFTSQKETKRILEGLKAGTIDIVFGTHRLLSDDVKFKKLGLLIVDEEQRFGVTHKEKIKKFKTDVNVLTLSATPIPRTMKMAMSGLRDLSIIDTPPVNRYPIQTYVLEENDLIIKDAIYKELARNGQIFILYNKVANIDIQKMEIQRLVPEAKIGVAHGQMNKNDLEQVMIDFTNKKYDILLCTTIIETGIDIESANTLIIIDADHFGLSQLYQIRGRIGRSNKIAYCYLMYAPNKILSEVATKRLKVIKDFTELGSGFAIAMRDLSIRGAGDILGSQQAGFIDSIGIELFMQMVNEEINKLKGKTQKEEETKDTPPLIDVSTTIEDKFVEDEELKIEIHKKICSIDSYESLNKIKNELEDRFGKLSDDLIIYMHEELFEKEAKKLNINNIRQTKNSIEITLDKELTNKIDGETLFFETTNLSRMFRFSMKLEKLVITLDTIKLDKHFIYYLLDLLKIIEKSIKKN